MKNKPNNNTNIKQIISEILKKDKLRNLKEQAISGDELAQVLLGEIYFYGITTDDTYWRNLNETIALTKYSKERNNTNYGFTCYCNQEPDYEEALKWYKIAAKNGNINAESRIKEIENNFYISKKKHLFQIFGIDFYKAL